ncbi:sulfate transporter CysZ, partial [Guyparkeria sp. 1SP6A2]|nr:sulfate transporter CysZ [Guyparkeria sp. 1SP6A2]
MNALNALGQGTRLVYQPGLRRYVFLPILVNLLVYTGMVYVVFTRFSGWLESSMAMVPGWLEWLSWLIWPLFVISLLVVIFCSF